MVAMGRSGGALKTKIKKFWDICSVAPPLEYFGKWAKLGVHEFVGKKKSLGLNVKMHKISFDIPLIRMDPVLAG